MVRTKAEKDIIKQQAMQSGPAFQAFLDALKLSETTPYDLQSDPEGLLQWSPIAHQFANLFKCNIQDNKKLNRLARLENIATTVIRQFQILVEDNRLSRFFYVEKEPRHERFAQLLFLAIAKVWCSANDVGMSPEADAGAGPVDFKFSNGADTVVVEIKLSTNSQCVSGYKKQLDAYMKAESAAHGHYVLIDVGKIGRKWEQLQDVARRNPSFAKNTKLHLIDGHVRPSASKL